MSKEVRKTLRELVVRFGTSVCEEPRRCRGLLLDYFGDQRRAVNLLVNAVEARVPADLLASKAPKQLLLPRLTKRLQDEYGIREELALWAVESWGLALGVLAEGEVTSGDAPPASVSTPKTGEVESVSKPPEVRKPEQPAAKPPPPSRTTYAPTRPNVVKATPFTPPPAAPIAPAPRAAPAVTPAATPAPVAAPAPGPRRSVFGSCLYVIFGMFMLVGTVMWVADGKAGGGVIMLLLALLMFWAAIKR